MKKNKFLLFLVLLLLLFSFTINVNAVISNYSSSVKYSDTALEIINNNQDKIELINQYFRNNGVSGYNFDFSTGNIIVIYDINSLNTNSIKAYLGKVNSPFNNLQSYYGGNSNAYKVFKITLVGSWGYNFTYNNGTISKSGSAINFSEFTTYYSSFGNPTIEDVVLEISDYYFDTSFISDTSTFSFNLNGAGVQTDIPYNLNGTIYNPPTSLPTKLFFDSFLPSPVPKCTINDVTTTNILGNVNNVSGIGFTQLKTSDTNSYSYVFKIRNINNTYFDTSDFITNIDLQSNNISVNRSDFVCSHDSVYTICNLFVLLDTTNDEDYQFVYNVKLSDSGNINNLQLGTCNTGTRIIYSNSPNTGTYNPDNGEIIIDNSSSVENFLGDSSIDFQNSTGFFNNFQDDDFGLNDIIILPLQTIQSLTNATCVPLSLPIPFSNSSISLPCMIDIYTENFPSLLNLWQVVSFGIISYFICLDIFKMVHNFKNPEDDRIEVLDL